jgi:hypothetical protein
MTYKLKETLAAPILGIDAELDVNEEFTITSETINGKSTGNQGFSLQLNGYSPQGFNSAWQQYSIYLDGGNLNWEIQNWIVSPQANPYSPGFIAQSGSLGAVTAGTLPKGLRLRVALIYDPYGFVLGANFFAYQGTSTIGQAQMLIKDITGPAISGEAFGSAPIIAFQLLVVGGGGDSMTTFAKGGSGTLTYKATSPLQATTQLPANAGFQDLGTGENSNINYGQVSATCSKTHSQSVSV